MILTAHGLASASTFDAVERRKKTGETVAQVELRAEVLGIPNLSDDAAARIALILRREAQRIAEIAAVDGRDAIVNVAEAKRIANADPNRPAIVLAAGTKDVDKVIVTRGAFTIGKKRITAKEG